MKCALNLSTLVILIFIGGNTEYSSLPHSATSDFDSEFSLQEEGEGLGSAAPETPIPQRYSHQKSGAAAAVHTPVRGASTAADNGVFSWLINCFMISISPLLFILFLFIILILKCCFNDHIML